MLKIFTDRSFIEQEYRRIIFPLLFDLTFNRDNSSAKLHYELTDDLNNADICIVPVDIGYFLKNNKQRWLDEFINEANLKNKKIWIYSEGDRGKSIKKDVVTFRLGGFHSKLDKNTYILPSFVSDPYVHIFPDGFVPLEKSRLPTIGFVGHSNHSFLKFLKELIIFIRHGYRSFVKQYYDYQKFYPSAFKRSVIIERLKRSDEVNTNFIIRKQYRAKGAGDLQKTTFEFFQNIRQNPYTLCVRGAGNFSVRFYETLAMGRIPLLVETDNRLPLDELIDWKQHCVFASPENCVEVLLNFHRCTDAESFKKIQQSNRELYLNFLTRENFFIKMQQL